MLHSKVLQEASASFPELEVGYLGQVFHEGPGRFSPQGRRAHNDMADGLFDPGNELLPCIFITRPGAEKDEVFQG